MKFSLSIILLFICINANAESVTSVAFENKIGAKEILSVTSGPGKKNQRRNKRLNKKRKRKCQQFGRKVYAG